MPTGYTHQIAEGITFNKFALTCARAFGALISMRDEPLDAEIPERFEPSDYNKKELQKAETELARLKALSNDEATACAREEFEKELKGYQKSIDDSAGLKEKYENMLAKVENWNPPTNGHLELKKFMVKQINDSIDFDCSTQYLTVPELKDGNTWLNQKINKVVADIQYHKDEYRAEVKRAESRTKWVSDLRSSLPSI